MRIIWSPAVTLDGYIAKADGDSDWVAEKDSELFNELIRKTGCVLVGRRTYEQYKGEVFPVSGTMTFVWTRRPQTGEAGEDVNFVTGSPIEVIKTIESRGYNEIVLAGGGATNDAFVATGMVKEIFITIYPIIFGDGIRLLSEPNELKLELQDSRNIGGGIIRHHYLVK